ncbi:MAG: putative glycoside hydrolase [Rubrivivax sp.]
MIVYYGGGPALTAADAARLAKYDLIDIDRFRYNQIGGNTWAAIKALNPNAEIYLYQMGPESQNYMDSSTQVSLNGIGRYNVARGHPMGTLNGNNGNLYLTDGAGARVYSKGFSNVGANQYWQLMDFGAAAYQSYWVTAAKADIIDQAWKADGIFADNCLTFAASGGYSATPTKYATNAAWSAAMNAFSSGIAAGLHSHGQKLWCNKGDSRSAAGSAAWRALDSSPDRPDILMEEGAFAVEWGAAVQFYPEAEWKSQVDTINALQNTKVGLMSHTQLAPGQTGTDTWGQPVNFYQAFYYAMGSMLLGKNAANNAYLMFSTGTGYNKITWYDEFDRIDLGAAVNNYTITTIGGVNVYWREFQRGYVAVNPTATSVGSFPLPQPVQRITNDNLYAAQSTLPSVSAVSLTPHSAAILYKTNGGGGTPLPVGDSTAPSVPTNLIGTAASATQVNLTWSASTDNTAVTGYIVYLNDNQLATVSGTSYQHTGLSAGTTYNYRVSAFDAVPNHSAWTATPVLVLTSTAQAGITLDIDGNGTAAAQTDGMLILRYLFGLTGSSLTDGAVGAGAQRSTPDAIAQRIESVRAQLDIDGNGTVEALTDGMLLLRYLSGIRGAALIANMSGGGGTRSGATAIEAYIQSLMQ